MFIKATETKLEQLSTWCISYLPLAETHIFISVFLQAVTSTLGIYIQQRCSSALPHSRLFLMPNAMLLEQVMSQI